MFDISALKEMKLELQEIAKSAKTIKFNGVKKETLIGSILEHQNSTTDSTSEKQAKLKLRMMKPKERVLCL
jgi:transcription termination factor Rho